MWPDGRLFEGVWQEGKQDGLGKYISSSGEIKYGEWEDGVRIGWIEDPLALEQLEKQGRLNFTTDNASTAL